MTFLAAPTITGQTTVFGRLDAIRIISFVLFALFATESRAQTIEQQTLAHIEHLRTIRTDADDKTTENYNKGMDAAWEFFNANTQSVLPILRRELTLELQKKQPNNLVLLDIGYYLLLQTEAKDKALGKTALFKLDPTSDIVYLNQQQLFRFAFAIASDQDPQFLTFLDKAFLRQKMNAFVPQHSLMLNETMVCVFLYGVHGPDSEAHLRNQLKDKALANKILWGETYTFNINSLSFFLVATRRPHSAQWLFHGNRTS